MRASSVTRRLLASAVVRDWAWWRLPALLRIYVGVVPATALAAIVVAASQTSWRVDDLVKFLLLVGCGLISVAATPRIAYGQGAIVRDFLTVWVLPVAILLPPFYAMVTPVPLLILTQWRMHRGVVYRRVFTASAIGLTYGAASLAFRAYPASFAGAALGTGWHALTWTAAVASCEIVGEVGHNVLLATAIRLSDPTARVRDLVWNREALQADLAEIDLGILITVVVAVDPALAVFAVPTVLLARRFMMHDQLLAKSRIDAKTGLLNAATWESEAVAEISRAMRTRSPLSVALIDIDLFKAVNDTYGHEAGDAVLKKFSEILKSNSRRSDICGRVGGEEFLFVLTHTTQANARIVIERVRQELEATKFDFEGSTLRVTASFGLASFEGTQTADFSRLVRQADTALYAAKRSGRNRLEITPPPPSSSTKIPNAPSPA
jgi:diguanylate cyclase (GGDEF)-like protein